VGDIASYFNRLKTCKFRRLNKRFTIGGDQQKHLMTSWGLSKSCRKKAYKGLDDILMAIQL